MNELSLFTGAGGGLYGSHILGWNPIGYVESNEFCQEIIRTRINDGCFNRAPIFSDVFEFVESGAADQYRGATHVVTGGFPCPAFSTARRGRGEHIDFRPIMAEVVRRVEPLYVFSENVSREAVEGFGELLKPEYNYVTVRLSAASVGAPHKRPRWWLLSYPHQEGKSHKPLHAEVASLPSIPKLARWENTIPSGVGVDDGMADRWLRLEVLGNAQVPQCFALAWTYLSAVAGIDL